MEPFPRFSSPLPPRVVGLMGLALHLLQLGHQALLRPRQACNVRLQSVAAALLGADVFGQHRQAQSGWKSKLSDCLVVASREMILLALRTLPLQTLVCSVDKPQEQEAHQGRLRKKLDSGDKQHQTGNATRLPNAFPRNVPLFCRGADWRPLLLTRSVAVGNRDALFLLVDFSQGTPHTDQKKEKNNLDRNSAAATG